MSELEMKSATVSAGDVYTKGCRDVAGVIGWSYDMASPLHHRLLVARCMHRAA
jgi:hypothetical protein